MSKHTIPWDPKQWLGDDKVLAMEREARSMHFDLLMLSVQQEPAGSIPNDTALLRRWLGSPSDEVWRRVWPQISSAWKLQDGRWFNRGMVKGVEKRTRYLERYEGGKNGAKSAETLRYIGVYDLYPRKVQKRKALEAINKAVQRLLGQVRAKEIENHQHDQNDWRTVQELLDKGQKCEEADCVEFLTWAVKDFAKSPAGKRGVYTPHPGTWFNGDRFLDDRDDWWGLDREQREAQRIQQGASVGVWRPQ